MPSRINIGPEDGPYVAINESSGNLQLEDNGGNVVAEWDETNAQWDFANNTLNNVDALDSNSVNTESLVIGGTIFEEDDNSPIDVTAEASVTYQMADPSQTVIVVTDGEGGGVGYDRLRLNGDTENNYGFIDNADNSTTGETAWQIERHYQSAYYWISGLDGSRINFSSPIMERDSGRVVAGSNRNIDPPINQLTFFEDDGREREFKARVYRQVMDI